MKFISWIFFIIFAGIIIGMLTNLPVENHQRAYMDFVKQYKNAPQKRVDDTMKYVEAIENGEIGHHNTTSTDTNNSPAALSNNKSNNKYAKPLYVRDKNNPKKLHKYSN